MTQDELDEVQRVAEALHMLRVENPIWDTNHTKFIRMDAEGRMRWWGRAKIQADRGAHAPRLLLLKVIELRLTS